MPLTQEDPAAWLDVSPEAPQRVAVVALEGLPGLLPAAIVALAAEAAGAPVTLLVAGSIGAARLGGLHRRMVRRARDR